MFPILSTCNTDNPWHSFTNKVIIKEIKRMQKQKQKQKQIMLITGYNILCALRNEFEILATIIQMLIFIFLKI